MPLIFLSEIMEESDWSLDKDFADAVREDFEISLKYMGYQEEILSEILKIDANCAIYTEKPTHEILADLIKKKETTYERFKTVKTIFFKEADKVSGENEKNKEIAFSEEKEGLYL